MSAASIRGVWSGLLGAWLAMVPVDAAAIDTVDAADAETNIRRTRSGHLVVRATVEGGECWFVLDSAAATTLLEPSFAAEVVPEEKMAGETAIDGFGGPTDVGLVRKIEVALQEGSSMHTRKLDEAVLLALPDFQAALGVETCGVLGMDVLRQGPVAIDPVTPSIDWTVQRPPKRAAEKLGKVTGNLLTTLLAVRTPDADAIAPLRTVRGVIDLGSPVTVLNDPAAFSLSLEPVAARDPEDALFSGADGRPVEGREARDLECELVGSAAVVSPCTLVVVDAPVFEVLELEDEPAAVLGTDVIRRPFVLDARKARLWWR